VGAASIKTTRYFDEQVLRKRPYLDPAWFSPILAAPLLLTAQDDGRIRFWGAVVDPRDGKTRYLRIVTLADGQNAFFDRDFKIATP